MSAPIRQMLQLSFCRVSRANQPPYKHEDRQKWIPKNHISTTIKAQNVFVLIIIHVFTEDMIHKY